jgi:hypothetical protein
VLRPAGAAAQSSGAPGSICAITEQNQVANASAPAGCKLPIDPQPAEHSAGPRHELRFGSDTDNFNYADIANSETISLRTRWTEHWSTEESASFYQRFDQTAELGSLTITRRSGTKNWLSVGGGFGPHQNIAPSETSAVEYGHAMSLNNSVVRGLESYAHQRNFWYSNTHVSVIGTTQIVYLPRDWMWTLNVVGVRTAAAGTQPDWMPSGFARLTSPEVARSRANLLFGIGAESFFNIDQIGHFSAHTFGGGVRYRINPANNISVNVAVQNRSDGRSETSVGASFGIRF